MSGEGFGPIKSQLDKNGDAPESARLKFEDIVDLFPPIQLSHVWGMGVSGTYPAWQEYEFSKAFRHEVTDRFITAVRKLDLETIARSPNPVAELASQSVILDQAETEARRHFDASSLRRQVPSEMQYGLLEDPVTDLRRTLSTALQEWATRVTDRS